MVVGDYGYRKIIQIDATTLADLAAITALRWIVVRPDGTRFERLLGPSDRDSNGQFTWFLQAGELTVAGQYKCQCLDVSTGRQIGTFITKFQVANLL